MSLRVCMQFINTQYLSHIQRALSFSPFCRLSIALISLLFLRLSSLPPAHQLCKPDHCEGAFGIVNLYLIAIVAMNISMTALLRDGGATVLSVASTLTLPLANIAFSSTLRDIPLSSFSLFLLCVCALPSLEPFFFLAVCAELCLN